MAFAITITQVRLLGINVAAMSKATIGYALVRPDGPGRGGRGTDTQSFSIDVVPGDPIPDPQTIANLIALDVLAKYGGAPDSVIVGTETITPELG